MAESIRSRWLFPAIFAILIALHVALLSAARLYPFVDLPDHLAAATIARDIGDGSNQFARYYELEAPSQPNTFHLFFCSLEIFPSVELANRIFFCLYAILLPLSVLLIIRKAGGNPWFSLFSFLLLYNVNVGWGFVGFAFAAPLVLLFYRFFVLESAGLSTAPRRLLAAAMLLLLFFVHLLGALFALMLLFMSLAWRGRRSIRRAARSVGAAAPVVVLVAVWWHGQERRFVETGLWEYLSVYYRGAFLDSLPKRWTVLAFDNSRLAEGSAGLITALFFSLAIIVTALVLLALRRDGGAAQEGREQGSFLGPRREQPEAQGERGANGAQIERGTGPLLAPLFLGSLICVLLLPSEIPRQQILYERFGFILLIAVAVVASTLAVDRGRRLFALAIPALCAVHLALWADYFIAFNRENAAFNASFLPDPAGGRKLAGLIYDYRFRGGPIYIHFPSYYIVWKKGTAPTTLVEYRFGPVRRRTSFLELPKYLEWVGRYNYYDGRYSEMDYLLVRGEIPRPAAIFMGGFVRSRTSGRWSLYERAAAPARDPKND